MVKYLSFHNSSFALRLHIVKEVVKHHFIHPFICPVIHLSRHGLFTPTGGEGVKYRHGTAKNNIY
jgi:hypothetical protein